MSICVTGYLHTNLCDHGQTIGTFPCHFCNLEKKIAKVENIFHEISKTFDRKPHRCPNCDGMGVTYFRDHDGLRYPKDCLSCKTKGIVWG